MAKMAFFDGASFLKWADTVDFHTAGNFKIKCNIKLQTQDGWTCWLGGAPLHLGTLGLPDNSHPGEVGWGNGNSGWLVSGTRIDDGQVHALEIEKSSGNLTIKVDTVTVYPATPITDGIPYDISQVEWRLGAYTDGLGATGYFKGWISEFELYTSATRQIYLPLTDDLLDHSGNDVEVTVTGTVPIYDVAVSGGAVETIAGYAGAWVLVAKTVIAAGDLTAMGLSRVSTPVYVEGITIPTGKVIHSATLLMKMYNAGGGIGLGGADAYAKIRAQKIQSPSDVTDADVFVASLMTTAHVDIEGQTYTAGQLATFDITSVITELISVGLPITRINLVVDDIDNRSSANNAYISDEFYVLIELEDAPVVTYTMAYNSNGGSGTLTDPSSPYNSGTEVEVLSNTFTRTGYTFSEWNTAADGSGTSYDPSDSFEINANTTLYAIWEETPVTSNVIPGCKWCTQKLRRHSKKFY